MRRLGVLLALALLAALAVPVSSVGHPERETDFPDPALGAVPDVPNGTPDLVVCKDDSERRIRRDLTGSTRQRNLSLLGLCDFRNIQAAVDEAENGDYIGVLPGVYRERPSRDEPNPDPDCSGSEYHEDGQDAPGGLGPPGEGDGVPNYRYHRDCPNSQNLIALVGDDPQDSDHECDDKCDIAIAGTAGRGDVLITGAGYGNAPGAKLNVIRLDRADGAYLANFTVQLSDFNNVYALETNGFRFRNIESRYSREYGFLSFTSDNGLYENLEAFGSGDSGVYPGSGPEGHCDRYGIEIRDVNSHGNTIGYSGTAGNGIHAHDNRFHDNATGMTTDSFAAGHPGMPQDCAKWTDNRIYSNNLNLFRQSRDEYCDTDNRPIEERDPKKVCPTFQVPVGTGALIAGGNDNIVRGNRIYDNWRWGSGLFHVPAAFREDPEAGVDTSFGNRFTDNRMGVPPGGGNDPNGLDFWWDEQGKENCWEDNTGPGGATPTSDPEPDEPFVPPASVPLFECPGFQGPTPLPGDTAKVASIAPCATWDPQDNPDPPGCDWFERPEEPQP